MATEKTATATEAKGTETLKEKLKGRLEEARQRLEQAKTDIENLHAEDEAAVRAKAAEIRERIESQKARAQSVKSQVSGWLREKQEQGESAISSWRQKREIKRLEHRADKAEEYAVNAFVVAMMDADEAEMAVLEAFAARLDADAAYVR